VLAAGVRGQPPIRTTRSSVSTNAAASSSIGRFHAAYPECWQQEFGAPIAYDGDTLVTAAGGSRAP
jgi:hypothetical protein